MKNLFEQKAKKKWPVLVALHCSHFLIATTKKVEKRHFSLFELKIALTDQTKPVWHASVQGMQNMEK